MTNVVGTYHVRRYNGTLTDSASGQTRVTEPGSAGALAFVKGIGSSGDTGTIDDNYRSIWPYQTPFALNHSSNGMTEFLHIETYMTKCIAIATVQVVLCDVPVGGALILALASMSTGPFEDNQ